MPNALTMLHQDHEKVRDLFHRALAAGDNKEKWRIFQEIAEELEIHAALEEEIFYPAAREATGREQLVDDSLDDHAQVKRAVSRLRLIGADAHGFDTGLTALRDEVEAHVQREEDELFPSVEAAMGDRLEEVGTTLMKRKTQLRAAPPLAKTIEVNVPTHEAYEQWSHMEEFPRFMEGVREVRKIDPRRMHWRAEVGGKEEEWDAEIDASIPDERIEWHSVSGPPQSGRVSFHRVAPAKTRILLEMVYKPEGFTENVGASMGLVSKRVEGDLQRFKEYTESRYQMPGA